MSALVESFKRLYGQGKVTKAKLETMLADGKITQKEFDYIIA